MGLLMPASSNGYAVFTANGTWTVPVGCNRVWVRVVGGGGGGGTYAGKAATVSYVGPIGVTPGQQITITIGAGGAIASPGGTSSFGTYVSAIGGEVGSNAGRIPTITAAGDSVFVDSAWNEGTIGPKAGGPFSGLLSNRGSGGDANTPGQPGMVQIFW